MTPTQQPTRTRRRPPRRGTARAVVAFAAALTVGLGACADANDEDAGTAPAPGGIEAGAPDDGGGDTDDGGPVEVGGDTADERLEETADDSIGDGLDASGEAETTADDDAGGAGRPATGTVGVENPVMPEIAGLYVGREIVFTGTVTMEVDDVEAATTEAVDVVQRNGGAVWGQDTRSGDDATSVLTIRVPPADFGRVMSALAGVGTVTDQVVTTDDVTERVIDLESRITAAESSAARVRALLDAANDLDTIFGLEEELAAREALLESLRGQLKTVEEQVALATITLTITEAHPLALDAGMEVIAWLGTDPDDACPGTADLSIGADDAATLCVNVSNTGDDVLTGVDVASPTFRLRIDDFSVVGDGSPEEIAPGDELLLAVELAAEGGFVRRTDVSSGVPIEVQVTAVPASTPSAELDGSDSVFLSADVDEPLPGFADSFRRGWDAMVAVVSVLMIGIGVVLPFLPLLVPVAWLAVRARRRAREHGYGSDPLAPTV